MVDERENAPERRGIRAASRILNLSHSDNEKLDDDVREVLRESAVGVRSAVDDLKAESDRWGERNRLLWRRHGAAALVLSGKADKLLEMIEATDAR